MKIAVLIQCHKNFDQINRLIRALKHPEVDIFIHIDRKAQKFRNMIRINEHVFILPENQCVDVQWAQISQVQASLNLIEYAMKENLKVKSERFMCDRGGGYSSYLLISGQDFPLKPVHEIFEYITSFADTNFIEVSQSQNFYKRNDIYFPKAVIGRSLLKKITKGILVWATGGWEKTFKPFRRKKPAHLTYYFGSSWWCISNETMKWICRYIQDNPYYIKFFSHSLCPDECFFQTLVMNSPYSKKVKPCLHYIKWEKGKNSPEILTEKHYDELINSGKLIARKFDLTIDNKILNKLEKDNVKKS